MHHLEWIGNTFYDIGIKILKRVLQGYCCAITITVCNHFVLVQWMNEWGSRSRRHFVIMASTRVSSLLNRFKFEQKAKKKLNASGSSYNVLETSSICENSSSVNAKHSEMNGDSTLSRSTTPDSDGKSKF